MTNPDAKVTRPTANGPQTLTARVWDLIDHASAEFGIDLEVAQGGFKGKDGGATASAGTHNVGDVFDLRLYNVPVGLIEDIVLWFRSWNGCAWPRTPKYGWTSTGPHIHCVMRDSIHGLSSSAKAQVHSYDAGRNGLAGRGKDPLDHPTQRPWVMGAEPEGEDDEMFVFKTNADGDGKDGGGAHYIVFNGKAVQCDKGYVVTDAPVVVSTSEEMDNAFYASVTRFRLGK